MLSDQTEMPNADTFRHNPHSTICLEGYVSCLIPPCFLSSCPGQPDAFCANDYCGGCNARYYDSNRLPLTDSQCATDNQMGTALSMTMREPIVSIANTVETVESQHSDQPMDSMATKSITVLSNDVGTERPLQSVIETVTGFVATDSCPQIGDSCTSALRARDRCCGGGPNGNTQCLYDDVDALGHELGTCCVRDRQSGCRGDGDCCSSDALCIEGLCRPQSRPQSTSTRNGKGKGKGYGARSIRGHFDNFGTDEVKVGDASQRINSVVIIVGAVVMVTVLSLVFWYWCFSGKCKKTEGEGVRREVFDSSDCSDREFQDSDDTEQDVEEKRAIYVD